MATIAPTPGAVINRRQTRSALAASRTRLSSRISCSRKAPRATSSGSKICSKVGCPATASRTPASQRPRKALGSRRPKPRSSPRTLFSMSFLPPKRPQLNGHVERPQGSWRYEFYGVEDLPSRLKPLQLRIDAFAHRFNHTRPHQALGDLTPAEYLSTISQ